MVPEKTMARIAVTILDRVASRLNHHAYDASAKVLIDAAQVMANVVSGNYDGIQLLDENDVDDYRDWLKAKRESAEAELENTTLS